MAGNLTLAGQAIEHWGWQHQIRKCCEEFSEAASKLLKILENYEAGTLSKKDINEALEECCDSDITLDQVKIIFVMLTGSETAFRDNKNKKEAILFDKICAGRVKKTSVGRRVVPSRETTRIQRGNCLKQSGSGQIQQVRKGKRRNSKLDLRES